MRTRVKKIVSHVWQNVFHGAWEDMLGVFDNFTKKFPIARYFRYKPLWSLPARYWIGQTRFGSILRLIRFAAPGELKNARLTARNLQNLDFTGFMIARTDFRNSDLRRTRFSGSTILGSHFINTDLRNTDFTDASFPLPEYINAPQGDGRFPGGTIMNGADLRGSKITPGQLAQLESYEGAIGVYNIDGIDQVPRANHEQIEFLKEIFANDMTLPNSKLSDMRAANEVRPDTAIEYLELVNASQPELLQYSDSAAYPDRQPFQILLGSGKGQRKGANAFLRAQERLGSNSGRRIPRVPRPSL